MRIEYDPVHDIMNIEFLSEARIVDSVEFDGVVIDYSKERKIVAIEILDAGERTIKNPLALIDLSVVKEKVVA